MSRSVPIRMRTAGEGAGLSAYTRQLTKSLTVSETLRAKQHDQSPDDQKSIALVQALLSGAIAAETRAKISERMMGSRTKGVR